MHLIKAVARAHSWYEMVMAGQILDQRSLAKHAGLSERYVAKVLQCAFLAPDIVEAILSGRQPRHLSFAKLCKRVPLSWTEQRASLGLLRLRGSRLVNNPAPVIIRELSSLIRS
jgi:site-specific DNA recombinase